MSAHTPWPWEVREFQSDIQIAGPEFREVALVRRLVGMSGECPTALRIEQIANAHLIAAAPEMLAVLREVDELSGDMSHAEWCASERVDAPCDCWLSRLRAAIAKAERR